MLDGVALTEAVGIVDVAIDRVTAIANAKLPGAEDEVASSTSEFRSFTPDTSSFSEVPLAQELAHQHQAAHQVFVETVDGVIADLKEFRQRLLDSMKAHENTDDAAHAALLSLGRTYEDHHHFHADQSYDQGRQEQATKLATSQSGATGTHVLDSVSTPAQQDGADAQVPTQPAAPAEQSSDGTGF